MFRENENLLGLSYLAYEKEVCIFNRKIINGLDEKLAKNNETEAKKPLHSDKALSKWARNLTGAAGPGLLR